MALYTRMIGWGVVVYALVQLVWHMLATYGLAGTPTGIMILILAIITTSSLCAWQSRLPNSQLFTLGFVFLIVVVILDLILYFPVNGAAMYANALLWLGYILVALPPCAIAIFGKYWMSEHSATLTSGEYGNSR